MLLSLVDSLRCPAGHEESSLVLSAEAWTGSQISSGVLGCPRCHARYPIRDGVLDFSGGADVAEPLPTTTGHATEAIRLAAQLGLIDSGGLILLSGRYTTSMERLIDIVDVTCLSVNADAAGCVRFKLRERLPLADWCLRGAAIDRPRNTLRFLAEVTRCVRDGGRLVAPADSPVPNGVRVVARDEREWVAEIAVSRQAIALRRGHSR